MPTQRRSQSGITCVWRCCRRGAGRARVAAKLKRPTKFAAVRVAATQREGVIEIDLTGGCVRVRGIVDAQMLREVLEAAR